jgi:hypothetical protein
VSVPIKCLTSENATVLSRHLEHIVAAVVVRENMFPWRSSPLSSNSLPPQSISFVCKVQRMLDLFYEFHCPDDRMLYRLYVRYPRVFWHEAIAELNQV